jgi:hypothetical protein
MTVWCTGCAGFEPLMSVAVGGEAAMVCASGMEGSAASAAADEKAGSVITVASGMHEGFSCGCVSCHAVTPVVATAASVADAMTDNDEASLMAPASVNNAPLIPPPQRTT